jgi:hypothetical protein
MPVKTYRSKDYLDYIGGLRCVVTGQRPVSCHHEAVTKVYSRSQKNKFDFGAIPLVHEIHLYERHEWGRSKFWEHYSLNPADVVVGLIEDYISSGGIDSDLASIALEMVKEDNGYST